MSTHSGQFQPSLIMPAVKLGRWGSMIDKALAGDVAKLSVAATACLIAFVFLRKRRIRWEKHAAARAAPPSLEPPAGWPDIPCMQCGSLVNPQGVRLRTFRFDAESPKAAVILVHGIGVGCRHEFLRATHDGGPHSKHKDSLIDVLQRSGVNVFAYDQQSHASSDSILPDTRCYFHRFDDLAVDLLSVHQHYAASLPAGIPIFWLGVSLGGGVALRAVQLRLANPTPLPPVQGLLLLAPMISLTKVAQAPQIPDSPLSLDRTRK
jgi:pimeloyl-ACP methyl ester carboxylesterase